MAVAAAQVRDLVQAKDTENVDAFLEDAVLLVNESLGTAGLSAGRIDLITKYLAAHFYTLSVERGGLISEKRGESEERYQQQKGGGLASTRFGVQALSFDTTGLLTSLDGSNKKAEFRVL